MGDLAAQTTSGLKPFPRVTVEVLGEDEIILDSVLRGKFSVGKSTILSPRFVFFSILITHSHL